MQQNMDIRLYKGNTILDCYKIIEKIGGGTFGNVYRAIERSNERRVALKCETYISEEPDRRSQLLNEASILFQMKSKIGFPEARIFGKEGNYNVLVMAHLGDDLEKLYNRCNREFTLKTIFMLGMQMVERVHSLHKFGVLHRDIKPSNFVMGRGSNHRVLHLIDLGLAIPMKDQVTSSSSPVYLRDKNLIGTLTFASLSACRGCKQSRRDDMESVFYTLAYFCLGRLPWANLEETDKQVLREEVTAMKMSLDYLKPKIPHELVSFMNQCRTTGFRQTPNYNYLRNMFHNSYRILAGDCVSELLFDWEHNQEYQDNHIINLGVEACQLSAGEEVVKRRNSAV